MMPPLCTSTSSTPSQSHSATTCTFSSADDSLTRDDDDAYVALEYEWPTPITDLTQDLDLKAWAELHNRSQEHLCHAHALVPLSTAIAQVEEARLHAEQDASSAAGLAHSMFTPVIVFVLLAAAVAALVCWGRRALFRVQFLESSMPYHSTEEEGTAGARTAGMIRARRNDAGFRGHEVSQ